MNRYIVNYNQSGGNKIVTKLRESICNQASNILSHLLNGLFIPQNSRLWYGTDFYNIFGNESAILNLSIIQLEYMISSINHMHKDASYSAKINMVKFGIDRINILKDSLHRIGSNLKISSIGDITRLKINCDSNNVPANFKSPIRIQESIIDNNNGPFTPGPYSISSPIPPSNSPSSVNYRCVYRDPTCIGDRDVITLDDINPNNIGNVVKVDKKCYNADELQKWLVNNSTLPHNRQPYTSKELNQCVGDTFSPSPPSISSYTTTISSPSLLPTSSTILSSPSLISTISTPFVKKYNNNYLDDDDWDLDDDNDWDLDDGTESKFISSFSNMSRKKKKSSKKKSSKKKSSKKKSSKKKSSKKKSSKKK